MITAGIDSGSRALKIVLLDAAARQVIAAGVRDQAVDADGLARQLLAQLLAQAGVQRSAVAATVATGYARGAMSMAGTTITEITCHAAGVRAQVPGALSVVEIGGQDSKVLRLDNDGTVRDFAMNDRCAAGTGRFLETLATRLETSLEALGLLASESTAPAPISATCVVFAESEIIGLLASGAARADIVAGVQAAIARRVAALAGRMLVEPVVLTGGVARVPGMREALERELGVPLLVAPAPQMTGALGAALLAARSKTEPRP